MALRLFRLLVAVSFVLSLLPAPAVAVAQGNGCSGVMVTGPNGYAVPALVCPPQIKSNGDLVVFAHGYVAPGLPLTEGLKQLTLRDGTFLPDLVTSMGYAFAASGYRRNGLAVLEGLDDTKLLVEWLRAYGGVSPNRVYVIGASEGGLVATLALERYPGTFAGGLAACGPIGDFRTQLNYLGDFRVLFDYYFRVVLPGDVTQVPPEFAQYWDSAPTGVLPYQTAIGAAMAGNPNATRQLLSVSRAAVDPNQPLSAGETALNVLWYSAFATNDVRALLGGRPFDNRTRWYFGSVNDWLLNRTVARYSADELALAALRPYQTSGRLTRPLVTLHNTLDPVVPYSQEVTYTAKLLATGSAAKRTSLPVLRYGHCNFTPGELVGAFGLLVLRTTGQPAVGTQVALPTLGQ